MECTQKLISEGKHTVFLTRVKKTEACKNAEGEDQTGQEEVVEKIQKRHGSMAPRGTLRKGRVISSTSTSTQEEKGRGKRILGVYGEIEVNGGTYLVYVEEHRKVGELQGHFVYEALSCGSICIDGLCDPYVKGMIEEFFKIPGLYFSECGLAHIGANCSENTDFIYNYIPLSKFRQSHPHASEFGIELVQGYVGAEMLTGKVDARCTLVSRRSWRNAGTRYYARGSDPNGDAANTVETLLIAEAQGKEYEFMQCRGSIPLLWEQKIDLSYKPPVKMGNTDLSKHLFMKHLGVLQKRYGDYFFINLLDEKGHEKELGVEFVRFLKESGCGYLSVDYHRMMKSAEKKAEFKQNLKKALKNKCIIRTNCVDCLDRTNVVQSQLSKIRLVELLSLQEMAKDGSVLDIDDYLNELSIKKLGQLWNNNANMLSMQYTGTSALKNDLTEHGVRTIKGLIQDAISSGKRYVNNNFTDGRMQEIIEIVTGVRTYLGNCIRGDRRLGTYFILCFIAAVLAYAQYSTRAGNAVLLCALVLLPSMMTRFLSLPSPRKHPIAKKEDKRA
ncbi:phosphatidylinositol 4-phosphatase [Nematocida major]|uniref:phosphatidylinositol 4-phosphatase n=1 Tax=Nematocida major TaxID=1912982 RepID=UPI002008C633|nr:phosphatidylinositol 4-phosphatase [Nematocida major]KAH9386910.1 phosphatidylinositol 4-phosphatase [Nematocida major]